MIHPIGIQIDSGLINRLLLYKISKDLKHFQKQLMQPNKTFVENFLVSYLKFYIALSHLKIYYYELINFSA